MYWQEIQLYCAKIDIEPLELFFFEQGACSVTYQDGNNEPILEPGVDETPLWKYVIITALFDNKSNIQEISSNITS